MRKLPSIKSIHTTKEYDAFLNALYGRVKSKPEELFVPPVNVIAVQGNEPPGAGQYQDAIAILYGIGYGLKMGLKFGKLSAPKGYFDYKVGALETFWWSTGKVLEIKNAKTLRWQAFLMLPAFVSRKLFEAARAQAKEKHPEIAYERAGIESVSEGRCVQMLHVGPYDAEQATIEQLHAYAEANGLAATGKHHEIYMSDPRRTAPAKLKTVIRFGVTPVR